MISFVRYQSPVCKSVRLSCGHVPTSLQRAAQTPVLLPVEVGEDAVLVAQSAVDSGQHRLLGLGGGGESPAEDGAKEKALLEHGGRRISRSMYSLGSGSAFGLVPLLAATMLLGATACFWVLLHASGCYCMLRVLLHAPGLLGASACYYATGYCCATCATVAQWILRSYSSSNGGGGQIR